MGLFFGILILVIAVFGLIFVLANAEQEHKQQKNFDKLVQQKKDEIATLDKAIEEMKKANEEFDKRHSQE